MKKIFKNKIWHCVGFFRTSSEQALYKVLLICIVSITFYSCNKLVAVKLPVDQLVTATVFADSTTAQAAVNGMYSQIYYGNGLSVFGYRISTLPAESADEIIPAQNTFDQIYTNSLVANNSDVNDLWSNCYNIIYLANSIINGVQSSNTLSPTLKKQLIGEAEFGRAFCDFYLVNYFGKVPLITSTDVNITIIPLLQQPIRYMPK